MQHPARFSILMLRRTERSDFNRANPLVIAIERHAILVAEKNLDQPEVPEPVTV
jgi:hypothetical protein